MYIVLSRLKLKFGLTVLCDYVFGMTIFLKIMAILLQLFLCSWFFHIIFLVVSVHSLITICKVLRFQLIYLMFVIMMMMECIKFSFNIDFRRRAILILMLLIFYSIPLLIFISIFLFSLFLPISYESWWFEVYIQIWWRCFPGSFWIIFTIVLASFLLIIILIFLLEKIFHII